MRLIQFINHKRQCKVGIVEDERVHILTNVGSTYDLFFETAKDNSNITNKALQLVSNHYESYQQLIDEKRMLVPLNHPDPYHTWITGTGLTHLGSASSRNAMHEKAGNLGGMKITDSMKMFRMGVDNGRMKGHIPASQPEWFYKGNGLIAVNPGEELTSPSFALDGGEEPEIVGLYIISNNGTPCRMGFALGNEFSDHKMEKINYLYLAHSKLRNCSYGPELLLGDLPPCIVGKSRVIRDNKLLWEKEFLTGEDNMSHNIANLEHHHFKYNLFRQPGDVHVHFFGTSVLSFADNIETQSGDIFEIEAENFGKPLCNKISTEHLTSHS